jgi:hypothetical protein
MSEKNRVPISYVVTSRGLEITVPQPYQVQGCLAPLLILLLVLAPTLLLVGRELGPDAWEQIVVLRDALGVWWAAAALAAAALTLGFSRHSNNHYIFGSRTVRDQGRLGRVVISDDDLPLARIGEVEVVVDAMKPGRWCVRCASKRVKAWPALLISPLDHDEAVLLAERIRAWLRAPGELPRETTHEVPAPVLLAETALAMVSSRIMLAIPFVAGVAALLVLALAWQLHEAQRGRGEPLPRIDRVADGELQVYRWVLHSPLGSKDAQWAHEWKLGLEIAIGYTPEDGRRRTLWLRTRPYARESLGYLGRGHLRQAAALYGPPAFEFVAPAWAGGAANGGAGWAEWRAVAEGPHRWDDEYRAARLLSSLDDPFHFLLASWTAPTADWRVAYDPADPDRAMPVRWAEAERAALERVSPRALLAIAGAAMLIALLTLPRLVVPSRSRRWVGRLAVLGAVLTVPAWAEHGERLAGMTGVGGWTLDLGADLLLLGAPETHVGHAWLTRSRPPSRPDTGRVVARWTPERSASAGLLRELGLTGPLPQPPLADSAAAVAAMVRRAAAALAALDDAALADFASRHAGSDDGDDGDALHEAVVVPALCAVAAERAAAGRPLPPDTPPGRCEPRAEPSIETAAREAP